MSFTKNNKAAELPAEIKSKKIKEKPVSLWRNKYIAALLCAIAVSFLAFGLVSPLRTLYARAEGSSGGEVGLMGAAYLFSTFVFLFPFGWLSDRYNRVNLIIGGLIAHGIITAAFLFAHNGEFFITLRFLEGISSAAVLPPIRALLADLTPRGRNGESFGMMSAMMTFGMLGGPPIGTFLAEAVGYQPAYWISAAIFLPVVIFVWYAFRDYKTPIISDKAISTSDLQNKPLPGTRKLFTNAVIVGCVVRVAISIGPGIGMSIWSLYVADLGYSLTMIGWTYSVYAVPTLLVAPSAGRLSDRYGRLLPMFVGTALVGLIWASYGWLTAFIAFMLIGVVEGSIDAVARSANDGFLADNSPEESRGKAQGIFNAAGQLGSLIGATVAGFLYEVDKHLPFFVLGGLQVAMVGVAVLIFLLTRKKDQFFGNQLEADNVPAFSNEKAEALSH